MKKTHRLATVVAIAASFGMPLIAAAQLNTGAISSYSSGIIGVINNIVVPVLLAVAFIFFVWGVFNYFILGAADEKKRTDGKQFTLWGIVGFVIIFSVWGLVNLVTQLLNLQSGNNPNPPTFNTSGSNGGGMNANNYNNYVNDPNNANYLP